MKEKKEDGQEKRKERAWLGEENRKSLGKKKSEEKGRAWLGKKIMVM